MSPKCRRCSTRPTSTSCISIAEVWRLLTGRTFAFSAGADFNTASKYTSVAANDFLLFP